MRASIFYQKQTTLRPRQGSILLPAQVVQLVAMPGSEVSRDLLSQFLVLLSNNKKPRIPLGARCLDK